MRSKKILFCILAASLISNHMAVYADFDTDNIGSISNNNGQSSLWGTQNMTEQNQNNQEQTSAQFDSNGQSNGTQVSEQSIDLEQYESIKNDISNQLGDDSSSSGGLEYNNFKKNMDSFLNSAGFDYTEFESMKFDLPDMSNIGTSADMKEEYANMLASFSEFGFGQRSTLPNNSGYSMNVIASFKDSFGTGLSTDLTEYKFTFDADDVFEKANSTRSELFSNVMNSSDYQIVSNNLNLSGVMNNINAYSIDPSTINTSMSSMDSLKSRVNSYYESDKNKNNATYNSGKSSGYSDFSSKKDQMESIKTDLEIQATNWFTENNRPDTPFSGVDQRTLTLDQWSSRTDRAAQNGISESISSRISNNINSWTVSQNPITGEEDTPYNIYQQSEGYLENRRKELREWKYYTTTEGAGTLMDMAIDEASIDLAGWFVENFW